MRCFKTLFKIFSQCFANFSSTWKGQSSHAKDSPWWVVNSWFFKCSRRVAEKGHVLHWNRLCSCLELVCRFKVCFCPVVNPHWLHSYTWPSCTLFLCEFRVDFRVAVYSHNSQLKIFARWTEFMCLLRFTLQDVLKLQ